MSKKFSLLSKLKAAMVAALQMPNLIWLDLAILLTAWALTITCTQCRSEYLFVAIGVILSLQFISLKVMATAKDRAIYDRNLLASAWEAGEGTTIILDQDQNIIYTSLSGAVNLDDIWHHFRISQDGVQSALQAIARAEKAQIVIDAIPTTLVISITPFSNSTSQLSPYNMITIQEVFANQQMLELANQFKLGIYKVNRRGNITHVNQAFCRMLGYQREELASNHININTIIREGYDLEKGESTYGSGPGSWQKFTNAISRFDEQIPMLVIQKVMGDEAIGYCLKLLDSSLILKAKGAEESWLDYSWQCFFKDSPYPVALLNQAGTIIKHNTSAAQMLKQDGDNILDLIAPHQQHLMEKELQRVARLDSASSHPLTNIEMRDESRVVDMYVNRIMDLNNDLYGFMLRISDVTQQHEFESNLSHTQRMQTIGYMSGAIAHDFNNILTAIMGFCDLLLLRHSMEDPSFHHVMQIKQSSTRAANLVNRLLAFSRKQTLHPQSLNLSEVFGESYSLIKRLVGANITVELDIAIDLWLVQFDPVQFEQVVLNLVVNAHHAIEGPGVITIKVYNKKIAKLDPSIRDFYSASGEKKPEAGEYVVIEIIDNGSGIDPKIYDKIFDPFFTTKQETGGTGLGLSTAYGIVRQSGGYLLLKSKLQEGTCFKVLLQRHKPNPQEEIIPLAVGNKVRDWSGTGTILLVEDEDAVRMFISSVLTSKGYKVLEYESAQEALERLEGVDKIDLVISDVVMPGTSGPEFVEKLISQYGAIKVMFISGYGEEVFTKTYGENRDFNFMPKPFTLKDLVEKVKQVMLS